MTWNEILYERSYQNCMMLALTLSKGMSIGDDTEESEPKNPFELIEELNIPIRKKK
ncbi:MAG TPA: hypothetical protein VMV86_02655 [Methanosarcinales archaeon]|nr:hypothetical protein [Methanosarcinales archaeon]